MKKNLFSRIKPNSAAFLLLLFVVNIAVGVFLLSLASYLPQGPIDNNLLKSSEDMILEGDYPSVYDHAPTALLDNWTDSLILMTSSAMNRENEASVFTNPYYGSPEATEIVESLYMYTHGDPSVNQGFYVRYWMGFRFIIRALLCVLDYMQIRRYIGFALFVLIALCTYSVEQNAGAKAAFGFFLSMLLVRPQVIGSTIQFSVCFFIALFAMLMVPHIHRNPHFEPAFFLGLGMATMFFDFYTSPLVTFGIPLVYLYLLKHMHDEPLSVKNLLVNSGLWLGAYISTWFTKLILTTVFSNENGIMDGMKAMFYRMGIHKEGVESLYSPFVALEKVFNAVTVDLIGKLVWLLAIIVLLFALYILSRKGCFSWRALWKPALLIVAVMPFIWFCVAAQPTAMHANFQYRNIVVSYWAISALICTGFRKQRLT